MKAKTAAEGRKLTELVEEGLRIELRKESPASQRVRRVRLPLIPAKPGQPKMFEGMTAEDIHKCLADLETETDLQRHAASLRH